MVRPSTPRLTQGRQADKRQFGAWRAAAYLWQLVQDRPSGELSPVGGLAAGDDGAVIGGDAPILQSGHVGARRFPFAGHTGAE
jgi:hypothetical protein